MVSRSKPRSMMSVRARDSMSRLPDGGLSRVGAPRGLALPEHETQALVAAQEAPELGVAVPRQPPQRAARVAPDHRGAAGHHGVLEQPEHRARYEIREARPHEV